MPVTLHDCARIEMYVFGKAKDKSNYTFSGTLGPVLSCEYGHIRSCADILMASDAPNRCVSEGCDGLLEPTYVGEDLEVIVESPFWPDVAKSVDQFWVEICKEYMDNS